MLAQSMEQNTIKAGLGANLLSNSCNSSFQLKGIARDRSLKCLEVGSGVVCLGIWDKLIYKHHSLRTFPMCVCQYNHWHFDDFSKYICYIHMKCFNTQRKITPFGQLHQCQNATLHLHQDMSSWIFSSLLDCSLL